MTGIMISDNFKSDFFFSWNIYVVHAAVDCPSLMRLQVYPLKIKMANNAGMLQSSIVLIQVVGLHNRYNRAKWLHNIVWHLFGDKQESVVILI